MCAARNTDYDFVEDLPQELTCNICMKVLNNPQMINCCGQCFCQGCLDTWFAKKQEQECPHCRGKDIQRMDFKPLMKKVAELKVYCSNKKKGCKAVLKLSELQEHLQNRDNGCGYIDVPCPNRCGKSFFKKNVQKHAKNKCPRQQVTCKYCDLQGMDEVINGQHLDVCQEFPVPCPNECGKNIERKEVDNHRKECPLEPVKCPFHEVGCEEKLLSKEVEEHIQSKTTEHLMKLMTSYVKLKSEHSVLLDRHSLALSTMLAAARDIKKLVPNNYCHCC